MDMRGTQVMSASSLTGIALSYSIVDYMRGLFTPGVAQSIKMGELIQGNRRALLFWAGVSVLLGLGASVFYTLHLGYSHGAYNFPRFPFFSGDPKGIYGSTLTMMHTPKAPDGERMVFFAIGAGLMALLTFLRYRFPGWPLHPIGLTLSAADNTAHLVMPVLYCLGVQIYNHGRWRRNALPPLQTRVSRPAGGLYSRGSAIFPDRRAVVAGGRASGALLVEV